MQVAKLGVHLERGTIEALGLAELATVMVVRADLRVRLCELVRAALRLEKLE